MLGNNAIIIHYASSFYKLYWRKYNKVMPKLYTLAVKNKSVIYLVGKKFGL